MTVLGQGDQMPPEQFAAMTGRQVAVLALFVPFGAGGDRGRMERGARGLARGVWLAGSPSVSSSFVFSNFVNYKLCDIFASLASAAVIILLNKYGGLRPERAITPAAALAAAGQDTTGNQRREWLRRLWPRWSAHARRSRRGHPPGRHAGVRALRAVVVLFTLAQLPGIRTALDLPTITFNWPGLHILSQRENGLGGLQVQLALRHRDLLLFAGIITAIVLRLRPWVAVRIYGQTLRQFGWAIVTVLLVFGVSYVMNLSARSPPWASG